MIPVGLGFRALKGGGVVVGVGMDADAPCAVLSSFLATAAAGDRVAREPYHVAAEMGRGLHGVLAEAKAVVRDGRERQSALALSGLEDIICQLRNAGRNPVAAALLVNRAAWIGDLLEYSLAFADHPPVAEGLAVRDALRFAFGRTGLEYTEIDEKSLRNFASDRLGLKPADIDLRLKSVGRTAGRPWRKEQKLACLAAWVALAARC
jgi:hypothetical protein